jgi:putative two-component system response regulator
MINHIVTTDDDPAIRKVLHLFLTKEGYTVTPCKDGHELEIVLSSIGESVDLILLDIKMPGRSGFEMLDIIKRKHPMIPVVMLTAFSDLDTGMEAIRAGASDYLTKPVRRETLLACVNRTISKSTIQREKDSRLTAEKGYRQELEKNLSVALEALKNTTRTTLEAFSETIEQKDAYTKGHCNRVRNISVALGRALKLSPERMEILEGGSLLHDIGKIGISEELLNKKEKLTPAEFDVIRNHTIAGERIIQHIQMFQAYRPIIRSHHERIDGKGYPDGLKGADIPFEVRIVSLADAFDAMTSNRAYRSALPTEIAVEEIKLCSGTQFDADLVNLFIEKEIYLL